MANNNSLLLEDIDAIDQSKDETVFNDVPLICCTCKAQSTYGEWKEKGYACPNCGIQSTKTELDYIVKVNTGLLTDSKQTYKNVDKEKYKPYNDGYGYNGYNGYDYDYGYGYTKSNKSEISKYVNPKISYETARSALANLIFKKEHEDIYAEVNKKAIKILAYYTDDELVLILNTCLAEGKNLLEVIEAIEKAKKEDAEDADPGIKASSNKMTKEAMDDLELDKAEEKAIEENIKFDD